MLSIMITCYNQYDFVLKNVNNILSNTKDLDIEIIISDDYSTDESYEKLKKNFKDNNNVIISRPKINMGVSNNRNNLFSLASKKYCLFIDGDDIQEDNYIKVIYDNLNNEDIYYIKSFKEVWDDNNIVEKDSLMYDNVFLYVYKTSLIKDKHFIKELEIGEDVEFGARYSEYIHSGNKTIDVSYLLNRREDNISLTKNGDIEKRYNRDKVLLEHLLKFETKEDVILNGKINQKKIDLINIGILIDKKTNIKKVNTKHVSKKHKISYNAYVILSKFGLKSVYKKLVVRFIGHKI